MFFCGLHCAVGVAFAPVGDGVLDVVGQELECSPAQVKGHIVPESPCGGVPDFVVVEGWDGSCLEVFCALTDNVGFLKDGSVDLPGFVVRR